MIIKKIKLFFISLRGQGNKAKIVLNSILKKPVLKQPLPKPGERFRRRKPTFFLKNSLRKKREVITGLDFNSLSLKLIQIRKDSQKKEIINLATKKCLSSSKKDISQALRELLHELKIRPEHLITSIPRHLTTIRYLELPSGKKAEIKEMVSFQAVKLIPYSREEMIIDHQIIETNKEGYSKVMVIIVHRDVINKHLEILREADLSPENIKLSSQAISNFYFLSQGEQNTVNESPVALIDIDFSLTNVEVVFQKKLIFSRSLSLGITHLLEEQKGLGGETAQGKWKKKLINEIKQSFAAYKRERKNQEITRIVLGGSTTDFPGLDKDLREEFSLPVEIIDLFANLDIAKGISPVQKIEGKEVSLWTVLGLAAAGSKTDVNLLPLDIQQEREKESSRKNIVLTITLSLIALLLIFTIFFEKLHEREKYLDFLNQRILQTTPLAAQVKTMKERIKVIQNRLNEEGSSLDILSELYRIIPKEISLTVFKFDKDKLITLKGTSSAMSDVFKLITVLEKSTYFENVEHKYAKTRRGKDITDFLIYCSLTRTGGKKH
ncbi:MAG: pilus assembly protein PilM [Nitrospirae bacterium]|nr:pilus assembly protein PilM [Nitrospirota bacterium]